MKKLMGVALLALCSNLAFANFREGLRTEAKKELGIETGDKMYEVEFSFGSNLDECKQTFINFFKQDTGEMAEIGVQTPIWSVETCLNSQDVQITSSKPVIRTGTFRATESSTFIRVPSYFIMRWSNDFSNPKGSFYELGTWFDIPKKGIKISVHDSLLFN